MKYRVLGKTGLKVSEIGFGCGNIGGLMIRAPFEERLSAVNFALELGINYFDTAAAYGNGQSEKNLGEVLASIKRSVILATKFGISREDDLGDIKGAVRRSLEASLKRLKRDSVDIFQLHTPVVKGDGDTSRGIDLKHALGSGGVADALDELRSQGLVRFIGFTGLGETQALHQMIESNRFDLCQAYCNLLNPSAAIPVPINFNSQNFGGLIGKAARNGIGVAAIRVLAGGALGGAISRTGYAAPAVGGALVSGSEYQIDQKRAGKLGFLLKADINNLSQAGIRFVLSQPGVSIVLVGFSNVSQIEEAALCSDQGPLIESDFEQLQNLWSINFGI
jgi:aryl-alcohol dehydrogenase-like predicted oxidoreductase